MDLFQRIKANQFIESAHTENIHKSIFDNDIEKGGEGSKGGKVIGHTKSGKPVYAVNESQKKWSQHAHNDYTATTKDYNEQDHKDAYLHQMKIADKKRKDNKHNRSEAAAKHHLSHFKEQPKYEHKDFSEAQKKRDEHGKKHQEASAAINAAYKKHLDQKGNRDNFVENKEHRESYNHHINEAMKHEETVNEIKEGNRQRKHEAAKKYASNSQTKKSLDSDTIDTLEKAIELGIITEDQIEKAKSGIYADTWQNRKKGVVGQKYGSEKKSDDIEEKKKRLIFLQNAGRSLSVAEDKEIDKLKNELKSKKETDISMHEDSVQHAKNAGMSEDEFKKLHPETKKELIRAAEKPNKNLSFNEVLANPEGKEIVEGIEGLDSKRADHKPLYEDYKKQLKNKFGYDYKDADWDSKSADEIVAAFGSYKKMPSDKIIQGAFDQQYKKGDKSTYQSIDSFKQAIQNSVDYHQNETPSQGKHIGDMNRSEKEKWAKNLGISNPEKLSESDLRKQILDKNVEKELSKFKNKSK